MQTGVLCWPPSPSDVDCAHAPFRVLSFSDFSHTLQTFPFYTQGDQQTHTDAKHVAGG